MFGRLVFQDRLGNLAHWVACCFVVFSVGVSDQVAAQTSGQANSNENCVGAYRDIYKRASPAVVFISVTSVNPYRLQNRVQRGLGSGFIIGTDGTILTNSHVVFGAQAIVVTLDNGASFPAKLVGADPIFDLALIRISPPPGVAVPTLKLGNSAGLQVGEEVIAIGNPLGLDQTLTTGVISALNRVLPETPLSLTRRMIQTDAAINPGNSGGPLLNRCGDVIGINTAGFIQAQNIGFAVPIDLAKSVLASLGTKGRVVRPWIGFHGKLVDQDLNQILNVQIAPGLLIEVVEPGSPAEKARLQGGVLDINIAGQEILIGGDIVTSINGTPMTSNQNLMSVMQGLVVGVKLKLQVFRNGKSRTVSYKLPERPLLPSDVAH